LIKESINKEKQPRYGLSAYIPGYKNLNSAEKKLAKKHPTEFVKYTDAALEAKKESEKYYGKSQLYQGNGDAFRHAFWNARIVQKFNGPVMDRVTRAQVWTNAHEATSSGIDKEMDLINNEKGRYHAYLNLSDIRSKVSRDLRKKVANGVMVRIVNGKLMATSRYTGK
jgi:hypothetical protein